MHCSAGDKESTYQLKPGDTVQSLPPLTEQSAPEQDGTIKLEIVKSLVYGGLNESIASLSVVTSAASAAASTCTCLLFFSPTVISLCLDISVYEIVATTFCLVLAYSNIIIWHITPVLPYNESSYHLILYLEDLLFSIVQN